MSALFSQSARRNGLLRARTSKCDNFLRERACVVAAERMADVVRDFGDILLQAHPDVGLLSDWHKARVRRRHLLTGLWELEIESFDLVYSLLDLHWCEDISSELLRYYFSLRSGGLLQACLVGGESLVYLRDCLLRAEAELSGGVHARVIPFIEMGSLVDLSAKVGFREAVVDREVLEVRYADIYSLMRDLRGMGEGNYLSARCGSFTRRGLFELAGEIYAREYGLGGGIMAKFELLFVHGWKF